MKLQRVTIQNFRCIDTLDLELHPQLTVLVSPNGVGKTTVIDALRAAVWPFIRGVDPGRRGGHTGAMHGDDVRLVKGVSGAMEAMGHARIVPTGVWGGDALGGTWQLELGTGSMDIMRGDLAAKSLTRFGEALQLAVCHCDGGEPAALPLVVATGPVTGGVPVKASVASDVDRCAASRTGAYRDCLAPLPGCRTFQGWYAWIHQSRSRWRGQVGSADNPFDDAIAVVQKAVNGVVAGTTGWMDLAYRRDADLQLSMRHPDHGVMPLGRLSAGLQQVAMMAADLAGRCAMLNPHFKGDAARKTAGIAMVDGLDMWLHPAWQQTLMGSLQREFPHVQFVVTTHSPQVLSTVKRECIRVLREDRDPGSGHASIVCEVPHLQSRGTASSDVLARVMEIDPIPDVEEAGWLRDYKALIQIHAHGTVNGVVLRKKLVDHFGARNQAMAECDRLIRWAAAHRQISPRSHPPAPL